MKLILTGATGRVGGAALTHCLANPEVTSLVVLSRRPLDVTHPKLTTVIQKDFLTYDAGVIEQLKGAQGCVWALGSPTSGMTVHVQYTRAALAALLAHVVPALPPQSPPFRFVLTSGGAIPYLDSPWLFFLGPWRKARGNMDREVLALESQHPGKWESFVARPWHVLDAEQVDSFRLISAYILRPQLGAVMADAAMHGGVERVMVNEEMKVRGEGIVKKLGL